MSRSSEQPPAEPSVFPAPRLWYVATPIGNLQDMTVRGVAVLNSTHLTAAEDTRRSRALLSAYNLTQRPLTLLFEHNWRTRIPQIMRSVSSPPPLSHAYASVDPPLSRPSLGVSVVSDAGTPGISDPGGELAAVAWERHREVEQMGISYGKEWFASPPAPPCSPVPGASALAAALTASAALCRPQARPHPPTGHSSSSGVVFFGFLPVKRGRRQAIQEVMRELIDKGRRVVLYESPARLLATLRELRDAEAERAGGRGWGCVELCVCRELSKIYEEHYVMPLKEAVHKLERAEGPPRGEFCLVLSRRPAAA
ncbi:unnamed protein product [Vitrella brassicaformis CCMP3155]|uniref:Tetrapyrrole methylase domain-containing protein n=1 Tax=Vitrella brassicaformis (strain CCMP3155) TaxID=1169540 RepID=A0A0G4H435_VITBC|nr:unnamed protein product [Vitrella brassicaformis CCMP3155]|eukprot:CEM38511.1 unnamed protein product [Vitrella brassicaformis CCMP3155]